MKFYLLKTASAHEEWSELGASAFVTKIEHFIKIEIASLRPARNSRAEAAEKKRAESEAILEFIKTDDLVVLFDERGRPYDSLQFSKTLEAILNSGKKRTIFVVGGAFGVEETVRRRANYTVALSSMVFNHLIAELVILEQIYRGLTIARGIPYHNK